MGKYSKYLTQDKKDWASAEILVGEQHVGKTTYITDELIGPYHDTGVPCYIFDPQREYGYFNEPEVADIGDIEKFFDIVENKWNSCIVFEEATMFFEHSSRLKKRITEMFVNTYHRGNVILLNFHSFSQVPKYIRNMVKVIHICHTNDTAENVEKLFSDPGFIEDFNKVQSNPDRFFKIRFDRGKSSK